MKHIIAKYSISLLMAVAMAAVAGCSHGISFDIEGELADKAASQVYLIVEKTTADTIATAAVGSDNRFRITGHADEPATAIICDDNGNTLTTLLLEKSPLRMRPDFEHGYVVEGGPVNDKYNIVARRLADITEEAYRLDPSDSLSRERFNSLANKYRDIVSTAVDDNIDNIIGVELFLYQESKGMSAGQMRSRFEQFPAKMRELTAMRRFADYIDIYERTEVGQKFIDLPLHTISGDTTLADVCKGKRLVLLDFWATWCYPCMLEMPYLHKAYTRYALQGLEICSISLDRSPERWRNFVMRSDMLWTNAIDIHKDGDECAVETYGLQSIPANFLIDADGTIIARNLRGEKLLAALEEAFGN